MSNAEGDRTVLGDIRCLFTSGSTVKAVISSGNVALFRDIIQHLPGDFDANSFKYAYLETAACSGQLEMVRSVLEPPRGPPHQLYGGSFEYAVAQAIRGRHRDVAWFLLRLRGDRSLPRLGDGLLHYGLREAARAGDADMVAYILEMERIRNSSQGLDCCRTPLEIACGEGHEDVVQVLLAAGVDPLGRGKPHRDSGVLPSRSLEKHRVYTTGSMFAAAVDGHVGVADLLIQVGALELGAEDWRLVVRGAIECGQAAFLDWILAQRQGKKKVLSDDEEEEEGWVSDEFDLLGEACVWGNAEILKVLQTHGFLQDRPVWALGLRPAEVERDGESNLESEVTTFQGRGRESLRYGVQPASLRFESPLLAAMSWLREDVVGFLLGIGWPRIEDVTKTSVAPLWREGRFPRRAVRHLLGADVWTWEASDAPP
ncbi:Ankyrin repeat and socs box protein 2 [Apiospora rasikravindrae]|uniref:Ankyrin repeat and socs box protein 2 n=1 Tax=Apiospora rasikravindrae TaxID=990691 RepID=A0ABR1SIJ6_9PEZI